MTNMLNVAPNEMQIFYEKERIRTDAALMREYCKSDIKEAYQRKKEVRHELQREARKAQYDDIVVAGNEIIIRKRNSWIDIPERRAANFKFRGLFPLISSDGDGGISALELEIMDAARYVYLIDSKAGRGGYLLRKIMAVGGQILVDAVKDQENFLRKFWVAILPLRTDAVMVPTHTGWVSWGNSAFRFVEKGATLWESVMKAAK
ncbi:hypothetical protein [Schaedlerella arabinosiphila]|jgi:hypothetical protein|uniref:hypothetical protein n=1 Tax=Schaedlerella arabinosiphila TaxID=2044587 RepID=UPI00255807CB|nr:hypothetical protein [Schaedlerella arabinosiphila]